MNEKQSQESPGTMFAIGLVGRVSWQCNECLRLNAEATTSGHGLNVHSLRCAGCGVEARVRVEMREEARVHYERLVLELSELLYRAIATHGELSSEEWQRMEIAQRQAYAVKHPEVREEQRMTHESKLQPEDPPGSRVSEWQRGYETGKEVGREEAVEEVVEYLERREQSVLNAMKDMDNTDVGTMLNGKVRELRHDIEKIEAGEHLEEE